MNSRDNIPLALLAANDQESIEGRTRLQKLIFLAQKEVEDSTENKDLYDFIAYDYGPFAKEIYQDIDSFKRRDLIEESPEILDDGVVTYHFTLTEKGKEFVSSTDFQNDELLAELENKKKKYADKDLENLVEYVYSEYPEYAENSVLY